MTALEPHFTELGRAVLAVSLPEYANIPEWKSAADQGARAGAPRTIPRRRTPAFGGDQLSERATL